MASSSAPESTLAVIFGQAVTRAVLLYDGQLRSTFTLRIPGELPANLTAVGKQIEKTFGKSINPSKVIVCGPSSDLEKLKDLDAVVVTEEKAVAAAEKYLSAKLNGSTAVLDVGPSAYLDQFPADQIARWLPFIVNLTDVENYVANKRDYPRAIPVTEHEYELDLAVARQAIIKLGERQGKDHLEVENGLNLVVTGGLLSGVKKTEDLLAVLLDSFVFKGGVRVYRDTTGELTAFGALLSEDVGVDVDFLKELSLLGSLIHLTGEQCVVTFGVHDKQKLSIASGDIVNLPIGDEVAQVRVNYPKSSEKYELSGGGAGIYLDNRPRPLEVVSGSKDSMAKIVVWRKVLETSGLFEEEHDITS
jgi:hypothetical protein